MEYPTCPDCGFEDQDWWDGLGNKGDGDSWKYDCPGCGNRLKVTLSLSPEFDTVLVEG